MYRRGLKKYKSQKGKTFDLETEHADSDADDADIEKDDEEGIETKREDWERFAMATEGDNTGLHDFMLVVIFGGGVEGGDGGRTGGDKSKRLVRGGADWGMGI